MKAKEEAKKEAAAKAPPKTKKAALPEEEIDPSKYNENRKAWVQA